MILVQTPTGTRAMDISEYLRDDINLNEYQSEGFIDPLSIKIPHSTRSIALDDFGIPDISEIEEIEPDKP